MNRTRTTLLRLFRMEAIKSNLFRFRVFFLQYYFMPLLIIFEYESWRLVYFIRLKKKNNNNNNNKPVAVVSLAPAFSCPLRMSNNIITMRHEKLNTSASWNRWLRFRTMYSCSFGILKSKYNTNNILDKTDK